MQNFRNCRFIQTAVPGIFQRLFTAIPANLVLMKEHEPFDKDFLACETIFSQKFYTAKFCKL